MDVTCSLHSSLQSVIVTTEDNSSLIFLPMHLIIKEFYSKCLIYKCESRVFYLQQMSFVSSFNY